LEVGSSLHIALIGLFCYNYVTLVRPVQVGFFHSNHTVPEKEKYYGNGF
jgi:hypothetical protein